MKEKPPLPVLRNYHKEEWHTPKGRALREVIFGTNDGLITTLGFLGGVTGAIQDKNVILLAALAEVVAGAFSMATGAYIASKSQQEYYQQEIAREKREIEEDPEHEKHEIWEIYKDRGFTDEEINILINRITSDKNLWLRFMLREELGLAEASWENPVRVGLTMGISFLIGSIAPILPYFFLPPGTALATATPASLIFLFCLGAFKTRVTKSNWVKSGLEMLAIGTASAFVGFIVGYFVSGLIGK